VLIGLYFASIGEIVHALLSIIVFTLFYIAADVIWILTEIQEFREKEQPKGRKKKK